MDKVLIVSPTLHSQKTIKQLLAENGFEHIEATGEYDVAKILLKKESFDLLIINAPLSDERECELAKFAVNICTAQVIVFVPGEKLEDTAKVFRPLGIFSIAKPINTKYFYSILELCKIAHNRTNQLVKQNQKLIRKLEDIKAVNRAKCILVEHKHMTEAGAHKYMEKCAMDMRVSKKAVADNILAQYLCPED